MARINVEDSLWYDARYISLSSAHGKWAAMGMMVEVFKIAQSFWIQDKFIPLDVWKMHHFPKEIEKLGIIEVTEKGVYVRGSEEQFEWLIQKRDAGRASAEKSRKMAFLKKSKIVTSENKYIGTTAVPREEHGGTTAVPPLSPSPSPSQKKEEEEQSKIKYTVKMLSKTWKETLLECGHKRNLSEREELLIYQALKSESAELIDQALLGARFEPCVKNFNPKLAPDICRILGDVGQKKPSQVAKFVGYASLDPERSNQIDRSARDAIPAD